MKIAQLLSGMGVAITNQEQQFIEAHTKTVHIDSLSEQDQWLAQTLVRKGIYAISNDNSILIKNIHETDS